MTPYSMVEVYRNFEGTYAYHGKCRRESQTSNQQEKQEIHARLGRATHERNTAWTPQYEGSVSEV
jgi:hypothetical protein